MLFHADSELNRLLAEDSYDERLLAQSISALVTLWRNGAMPAEQVLEAIQNIVG